MKMISCGLAIAALLWAWPVAAQLPSNATLNGVYYFRYLGVIRFPSDTLFSAQGTIAFDGLGGFTLALQETASGGSSVKSTTSGKYSVTSSGILTMTMTILNPPRGTKLVGGVGAGAIVAISADPAPHLLFVAIPVNTTASTATFNGTYKAASLEFLNGNLLSTRDTFFSMSADGKGSLGNITVRGTAMELRGAPAAQTITGATYVLNADGSGTLGLPAPAGVPANQVLMSGNKTLYVSRDGNLFLAGGATSLDMVIGVRAFSGASPQNAFSGLYFTGMLENLQAGTPADGIYSLGGSANEAPSLKAEVSHQRVNPDGDLPYDFTQSLDFTLAADGTASYPDSQYALGMDGSLLAGGGNGFNYQLTFYVKAPTLTGTGVFLNPQGVVNAASSAPITAPVAPGEFISLYGSGLASQTLSASSLPIPTTLGGVQVTINGLAAPVYYVSPTVVSAIVPSSVPSDGSLLTVQVTNNGTASNPVLVYSGQTAPGVFTLPPGGIGSGMIQHADFSLVSASSPAKAGETVQIYVTGLGAVSPGVATGAAAPANPLSKTVIPPNVYVDGLAAKVQYAGLAPNLANLYQLNVTIPTGVGMGNVTLEISTAGADNRQATIPIGR